MISSKKRALYIFLWSVFSPSLLIYEVKLLPSLEKKEEDGTGAKVSGHCMRAKFFFPPGNKEFLPSKKELKGSW